MGGKGSKTYEETQLSDDAQPMPAELHIDRHAEAFRIDGATPQKFLVETSKIGAWLKVTTEDGNLILRQSLESLFKSRSVVRAPDSTQADQTAEQEKPTREICVLFEKTGFGKMTTSFFRRNLPAYEGQEHTPGKHSKKGKDENEERGKDKDTEELNLINDESGNEIKMYKIAEIVAKHGLTGSSAEYRVITGPPVENTEKKDAGQGGEMKTLLHAERLTLMKFRAVVRACTEGQRPEEGKAVAKCLQANTLATKFELEIAPGQDIIAICSLLLSVADDGGSTGALAGGGAA